MLRLLGLGSLLVVLVTFQIPAFGQLPPDENVANPDILFDVIVPNSGTWPVSYGAANWTFFLCSGSYYGAVRTGFPILGFSPVHSPIVPLPLANRVYFSVVPRGLPTPLLPIPGAPNPIAVSLHPTYVPLLPYFPGGHYQQLAIPATIPPGLLDHWDLVFQVIGHNGMRIVTSNFVRLSEDYPLPYFNEC